MEVLHANFFLKQFSVSIRFVHATVISTSGISVGSYMFYYPTILSESTYNLMVSIFPFPFVTKRGFRTPAISEAELFATVAGSNKLSSLVTKCSMLYFAGFLDLET